MATVYRPIGLSPNQETRDMLLEQIFTAIVQSTTTDYQLRIYNLATNALLYDSTKITLGTTLFATETISITVPITGALATVRELKWTLEVWNSSDSVVSRETPFTNYEAPTASLSSVPATITEQSYEFIIAYNQNQGIEPESYILNLYDSSQNLIDTSNVIYNSSLKFTFENFVDGTVYFVRGLVVDQNELEADTGFVQFTVDYTEPSVNFTPTVENLPNSAGIEITWVGAYILEGVATGTINYVDDFLYVGNKGLEVTSGSNVEWEGVNIEAQYTASLWHNPNDGLFDGDIIEFQNTDTSDFIKIGYDNSENKFYRNQNGIFEYTVDFVFNETNAYLIIFTATTIEIKVFTI